MPRKSSGSRSRSASRSRSTQKKNTPSSRPKTPVKKTPSKSPARTPKSAAKSPGRKPSKSPARSSSGKRLGRPPGSGIKPVATSTPKTPAKTPAKRSASLSSARSVSAARRAPAEPSALRIRSSALTSTPRAASPRGRDNGESLGCKYNTAICNFAKDAWGGFKDGFSRKQLTRRDKERRNRVWKVIFLLAFVAFLYYTYVYKYAYYKQAAGYAQGYMDAARDFVNKKIK